MSLLLVMHVDRCRIHMVASLIVDLFPIQSIFTNVTSPFIMLILVSFTGVRPGTVSVTAFFFSSLPVAICHRQFLSCLEIPTEAEEEQWQCFERTMAPSKPLSLEERRELATSLEHIVTVGCCKRDDARRQHEASLDNENQIMYNDRLLHAEDTRLYQTPLRWCGRHDANFYWECEYGDDLGLYAFYETPPPKALCNHDKSLTAVPREILLRCWERAVQAASNQLIPIETESLDNVIDENLDSLPGKETVVGSIVAGVANDQNIDLKTSKRNPSQRHTNKVTITPDDSIRRCHGLHIPAVEKVCLRCGLKFDSIQECHDHFHGTIKVLGCCWPLVKEKERALMRALLEEEVKVATTQVVQLIQEAILPNKKRGWCEILRGLDSDNDISMLSPVVVENIKRRVRERYANLPW
jgi:hypothetical protein